MKWEIYKIGKQTNKPQKGLKEKKVSKEKHNKQKTENEGNVNFCIYICNHKRCKWNKFNCL